MTTIEVYDYNYKTLERVAELNDTSIAEVIETLMDYVDEEYLTDNTNERI